ncbi:magnesium/cobalt transporter CorA [Panacibacter ginsenosidivorans]|uniref:Magnesium transport protein CorA n=1 Tax=Panacibacter ginsenosidivorans TaxID=1813871 RepID=A0A5B8VAG6_9BACT|nr:magnesium/cobalt transporter CorA [Panacibacter ginsenosidivorans]QEC68115.1 magnesium/cobalt transporter CorA [Panacibacter ginsenosidivorans]
MIEETKKYLHLILPFFNTKRTKEIFRINPTVIPAREEAADVAIYVYDYDQSEMKEYELEKVTDAFNCRDNNKISWINIDGIRKSDVEAICKHFGVHMLLMEDILSVGQRPKMDEIDNILFCLMNMLYFNDHNGAVESEQISIVLGKNFVISFQDDKNRDVFDQVRDKLRIPNSKLRQSGADYLCYAMIDLVVDHYYLVMEKLGERIEQLEEEIIRYGNSRSLARINNLRKELIVLKRNMAPVRDMINGFLRSESDLLQDRTTKYFKDVYDHIVQASDLVENYRDMMMTLQDLYMNKVNLRLNEVMKVMAIVTCLLAPAAVIGGIFGMNFEVIPLTHQREGFYVAVALMFIIPIWMIRVFKKRGWF